MTSSAKYIAAACFLLLPGIAKAQSVGQVECPRSEGYVYLYSSMTTMDVRTTLQCGEHVQITGRYDYYFSVRTEKGESGFMPQSSLLLLKDAPGPKAPQPQPARPPRARTAYDDPSAHPDALPIAPSSVAGFTLRNGTAIHLALVKAISTASAHVGDVVDLKVLEDVAVEGITVIPTGATAIGIVTDVEPKKRLGHGGKLGLTINFVHLSNNEKAAVRSYQESSGTNTSAGGTLPRSSGKDITFPEGTEFTAYVDGDILLKKEAFQATKSGANPVPAPSAPKPSQPRGS